MLKIENLSVAVQGRQILHDINLHIKPGEVHVLFERFRPVRIMSM